jgi:hypothetical protein
VKGILFGGIVESLRSRKDKTIAVTIGTQELSPEKAGELFNTNSKLVTCYLSIKGEITDGEAEIIDSIEPEVPGKRPSQRMRSVLFRLWEQAPEGYNDFNLFYIHRMDQMIEKLKSKLEH